MGTKTGKREKIKGRDDAARKKKKIAVIKKAFGGIVKETRISKRKIKATAIEILALNAKLSV